MDKGGVRLFLFGDALKKSWKLGTATAVAVLAPAAFESDKVPFPVLSHLSPGPSLEGKQMQAQSCRALKVVKGGQVVEVGDCPDLGSCKGTVKATGRPCANAVPFSPCPMSQISQELPLVR